MIPNIATFALITFAALSPLQGATPESNIRLRVSNLVSPSATDPAQVADLRIQQEFLRRNPGVELVRADGIHLEGAVNEVNTIMMIVGGIAPDIISMNFRSTDSFVRMGIVSPLNPLLDAESPQARTAILDRIPPQVVPAHRPCL